MASPKRHKASSASAQSSPASSRGLETVSSLRDVYPPLELKKQEERYALIEKTYKDAFGGAPQAYLRSPGRVNLIGEHVDYSGYSVCPMAISNDVVMAVGWSESSPQQADARLTVTNVNKKYATHTFSFPLRGAGQTADINIDAKAHRWSNYFLCGYKAVLEHLKVEKPYNLQVAVSGTVPAGAGLSSSSALVCVSACTTLVGNQQQSALSLNELAQLAIKSEKYVGTEGGGMDQAISLLAQYGFAKHIQFHPLRSSNVKLPTGSTFIITHTLVEQHKQQTAATLYNKRVVECRLAGKLLAKSLGVDLGQVTTLASLQQAAGKTLAEMVSAVKESLHEADYSTAEIEASLGAPLQEFVSDLMQARKVFDGDKDAGPFRLYQRSLHCFSEALRVQQFLEACDSKESPELIAKRLGQLMDGSQTSCDTLYNCSCDELDLLTAICREAGALGSRLTGAGWGGCAVSLVKDDLVDSFIEKVCEKYYTPDRLKAAGLSADKEARSKYIFASKPGRGAVVYVPK